VRWVGAIQSNDKTDATLSVTGTPWAYDEETGLAARVLLHKDISAGQAKEC
jgi:hypothetical protein